MEGEKRKKEIDRAKGDATLRKLSRPLTLNFVLRAKLSNTDVLNASHPRRQDHHRSIEKPGSFPFFYIDPPAIRFLRLPSGNLFIVVDSCTRVWFCRDYSLLFFHYLHWQTRISLTIPSQPRYDPRATLIRKIKLIQILKHISRKN